MRAWSEVSLSNTCNFQKNKVLFSYAVTLEVISFLSTCYQEHKYIHLPPSFCIVYFPILRGQSTAFHLIKHNVIRFFFFFFYYLNTALKYVCLIKSYPTLSLLKLQGQLHVPKGLQCWQQHLAVYMKLLETTYLGWGNAWQGHTRLHLALLLLSILATTRK